MIPWVKAQLVVNGHTMMNRTYCWPGITPNEAQRLLEVYIQREQLHELGPWYIRMSTNLTELPQEVVKH